MLPAGLHLTSVSRSLHWFATRSLLAVLSTLIIVLPVPIRPSVARADAYTMSETDESFNFSSQSASSDEGMVESAGANALKQRTSPVSSAGAFSTGVSIEVPPGRSGMTPSLGLSYVSDGYRKDSPVGAGWSFGAASISRDTSEGFPPRKLAAGKLRYDDDKTLFSGPSGRLVRNSNSEGLATTSGSLLFVPEREHSPVRYEYLATADRWIEHLPSGIKRYYGAIDTSNARVKNELGTHEWLLLKERDADGNTIEYDYHFLDGLDGQARFNWEKAQAVPVLRSVRWGANDVAKSPHLFRIATETRPYAGQLDMLNGHTLLTGQVTAIKVYGPISGGVPGDRLYWQYTLGLTQSSDTFRHLLRSVTRTGFNIHTGAAEGSVTKRFTYADNGAASLRSAGTNSAAVNAATRQSYSELLPLPGDPEIYQGGFRLDITKTGGGRPTFDKAQIDQLNNLVPMEQLSPEHIGAGYRFEDIDTDGDVDVLYNPTGLNTPAARLLLHKSYLNDNGKSFARVLPKNRNRETFNGISGGLLISSLADVDGDSDPDAVSFPVMWADPIAGQSRSKDFRANYSASDDPFDLTRLNDAYWETKATVLSQVINPATWPTDTICVPDNPYIQYGGGVLYNALGALPGLPPVPGLGPITPPLFPGLSFVPPLWPFPPSGGGIKPGDPVGTQDPEDNLVNGDPMLDIRYRIDRMLGYCRYTPWFVRVGAMPVRRQFTTIRVAYNTSRGTAPAGPLRSDGTKELTVRGWPTNALKQARWGLRPSQFNLDCASRVKDAFTKQICETNLYNQASVEASWKVLTDPAQQTNPPRVLWNAAFVQASDFQAPLADVNADGRADIVLLKSMNIFAGGTTTNFSPNVFLSTGAEFIPEKEASEGLAVDLTDLLGTINWTFVDFRRAYLSTTRPLLERLRPGPALALPPKVIDVLPAAQRTEVTNLLNAFRTQDPNDANVVLGLQTAVIAAFDRGVAVRYPTPVVSLRNIATQILVNTSGWFGNWFNFSINLLPDINLDLSETLIPMNDRTYMSLPGMIDAIIRMGRRDALSPIKTLVDLLKPMLGSAVIDALFPTPSATTGFTDSALNIFNAGRDTVCELMDNFKTCARVSSYPINIDFNAFMFDANGDGLPDMVAAHQPTLVPNAADTNGFTRGCLNGHQVHLNRGYRWEDMREAALGTTLPVDEQTVGQDGWSTGLFKTTRDKAFSLLNQRTKECTGGHFIENDYQTQRPAFAGLPMSAASFSDINADGLTDVVFAAVTQGELARQNDPKTLEQFIFLNTGRGFVPAVTRDASAVATFDADLRLTGTLPWRGLPSDFYMTQYVRTQGTTLGTQDRARLVDVDSDGLLDIVYRGECQNLVQVRPCSVAKWRRNLRKIPDLLTRIDEGSGAWTEVDYVSANSDAGRAVVRRSQAQGAPPTGLMVASEIRSGAQPIAAPWAGVGGESAQRIQLRYDNYAREQGGKRALGFEMVSATFGSGTGCSVAANGRTACTFADVSTSTYTYDVSRLVPGTPVPYPLRGSLRSERSLDLTGPNSEQVTTYDYLVSALGNAARIRSGRMMSKTREGSVWMYSVTQPSLFDSFGYAQTSTSARSNENGLFTTAAPETTITTTTYSHRAAQWRLGRPDTVTLEGDRVHPKTGARTRGLLSKTVTKYDSLGRVDTHSVLQDSGSADCSAGKEQWNVTRFSAYNAVNLPELIQDNGTKVTIAYDAPRIYPEERTTIVPVSPSSPRGATLIEEAEYDLRFGSVAWTRDMNRHITERTYDSRGRLLTTSIAIDADPDGDQLIEQRSYSDINGGPWTASTTTYTTPNSSFTTWSLLDGEGRTLVTNKQVSASSAIRVVRDRFDGLGRLIASYQSATLDAQPSFTLQAVAIESTAPATYATYDGFDRVRSQTLPDGRVISKAYTLVTDPTTNAVVSETKTTNPRGLSSVRRYDTRGSLVSLERRNASNSAALSYRYEYDGAARMVAVKDALATRRVGFDEGGRLRYATLPHASGQTPLVHSYCYDARGKLAAAITPVGRDMVITRDALGRVASLVVDYDHLRNGSPVAEPTTALFEYDCSAAEGSLGKMCRRTDPAGTTYITYDLQGRPNRYETTMADAIAQTLPPEIQDVYAVQLNYGLAGQLNSMVVEGLGNGNGTTGTRTVTYARDLLARTNGIQVSDGTGTRPLVTTATYDAFDRLKNATLGNTVVSDWTYDLRTSYLTSQRMLRGTTPFAEMRYPLAEYDPNGNIRREQRFANGQLSSEKAHTFDVLDQLETSTLKMAGVERKNERFTINQGNLTSVVAGSRTDTYAYSDKLNTQAVKSITSTGYSRNLTYDADGWVSRDVETRPASGSTPATTIERSIAFDASGCMREAVVREAPVGTTARTTTTRNLCGLGAARAYRETTFPDGRVERVYYLPDGSELRPSQNLFVMQLPVATATTATLAWSLSTGAIVQEESGYIHTDMRGSVMARTRLDASDVTVADAKAEYGAWGDTVAYGGVKTPRFQFINEEPDPGTGYYYFGARPYDPTLRRWLSPDPMMMGDLAAGAATVVDLNVYAYAGNNPVNRIDKSGFSVTGCGEGACLPNSNATEMIYDLADGAANGAIPHGVKSSTFGHEGLWNIGRIIGATAGLLADAAGALAAGAAGASAVVSSGGTAAMAGATALGSAAVAAAEVAVGVVQAHGEALADAVNSLGSGNGGESPREVKISRERHPESAQHIEEAQAEGKPTTLTIDREGAAARRKESMNGTKPSPGKDRDEYPPALFKEGGKGSSVKPIAPSDNRGSGACIGQQCRDLPNGAKVDITVTD